MATREPRSGNMNVRISDTGRYLMDALQEHYGLSQSSIIEMLLRDDARRHGIPIPGSGADKSRREAALALAEAEALASRKRT